MSLLLQRCYQAAMDFIMRTFEEDHIFQQNGSVQHDVHRPERATCKAVDVPVQEHNMPRLQDFVGGRQGKVERGRSTYEPNSGFEVSIPENLDPEPRTLNPEPADI